MSIARNVGADTWGERLLGIDLRSLAACRVALGLIVLWDLGARAVSLTAHYTDAGVVPRTVLYEVFPRAAHISLHLLSGSWWWQAVLFGMAAAAAVALVVGYYTRCATALSWAFLLSLHARNPALLDRGDALFLLLLFWGMMLPWGMRWSVDAGRSGLRRLHAQRAFSLATAGVLLQICFVYWFSVLWKSGATWHADGTAVYYTLHLDRLASTWGQMLLKAPSEVLRLMTYGTFWLEALGPLLTFAPLWHGPVRASVVLAFWGLHAGLALTMTLGIFPFVCMAAWLLFVPSWVWDQALPHAAQRMGIPLLKKRPDQPHPALHASLAVNLAAAAALFYIGCYNVYTLNPAHRTIFRRAFARIAPVGEALGLRQRWSMFAPSPPPRKRMVYRGRSSQGRCACRCISGRAACRLEGADTHVSVVPRPALARISRRCFL